MADSRELIQQAARAIEASQKTSATPAGPTEPARRRPDGELVEAINQVFALFRLNYHNQFYAAFPDEQQLAQAKRLWLESLADYPVAQLLLGARHAIEHSEYLPTLHRMHESCRAGLAELGLPPVRDAFVEACRAPSPKSAQPWSHPAVYLAGRDSDWFFLANNPEQVTYGVFRDHYQRYCALALQGETLEIPAPAALEQDEAAPLSREEQLAALRKLREETGL